MTAWSSCSAPGNGTRRIPNRVEPSAPPITEQRTETPEQPFPAGECPILQTRGGAVPPGAVVE